MYPEVIRDQHPQTESESFLEHQVVGRLTATVREQAEHHLVEHLDIKVLDSKDAGDLQAQEVKHGA